MEWSQYPPNDPFACQVLSQMHLVLGVVVLFATLNGSILSGNLRPLPILQQKNLCQFCLRLPAGVISGHLPEFYSNAIMQRW